MSTEPNAPWPPPNSYVPPGQQPKKSRLLRKLVLLVAAVLLVTIGYSVGKSSTPTPIAPPPIPVSAPASTTEPPPMSSPNLLTTTAPTPTPAPVVDEGVTYQVLGSGTASVSYQDKGGTVQKSKVKLPFTVKASPGWMSSSLVAQHMSGSGPITCRVDGGGAEPIAETTSEGQYAVCTASG